MGYAVHFYHMGTVVFCQTLDQVELCKVIKNALWFVVCETNEDFPPGTEMADWAWLFGDESKKRKVVDWSR